MSPNQGKDRQDRNSRGKDNQVKGKKVSSPDGNLVKDSPAKDNNSRANSVRQPLDS